MEWSIGRRERKAQKRGKIKSRYDSENIPFSFRKEHFFRRQTYFISRSVRQHTPARESRIFLKFLFAHDGNFFLHLLCAREFAEIIVPITFRCLFNLYATAICAMQ